MDYSLLGCADFSEESAPSILRGRRFFYPEDDTPVNMQASHTRRY
jgi:hypothetical protein